MPHIHRNNYDLFSGTDLEIADLILRRRLQLLVHSCIYYEHNYNIISDKQWDEWAKELVVLQRDNPSISEQVDWYEAFKDWDASTGAFLPLKDEWVVKKASILSGKSINKPSITGSTSSKKPKSAVLIKPTIVQTKKKKSKLF